MSQDEKAFPREDREAAAGERQPASLAMPRRDFLQVGLMGMAASAVAGAAAAPAAELDDGSECGACNPPPSPSRKPDFVKQDPEILPLDDAFENWNEPWVWRPGEWPGQQLDLNVVENQNPGIEVGLGNAGSVLFSYGGNTPGPTVRMRGDEALDVKLRNLLGEDCGVTFVGPFPDLNELVGEVTVEKAQEASRRLRARRFDCATGECVSEGDSCVENDFGNERFDFCIGEHVNGVHSVRVTNLHTHGLHVRPDKNPDGTHSDNVILRVISQDDFMRRERAMLDRQPIDPETCRPFDDDQACPQTCPTCAGDPGLCPADDCSAGSRAACDDLNERIGLSPGNSACAFLRDPEQIYFVTEDEVVAESSYAFRLGDVQGRSDQPHPPGTHWYHPHAHGATAMQVGSGMAGFLIIEGDVDDCVNCVMTGSKSPDPTRKTGPYDYRERLMFMQRVFTPSRSRDKDSPKSQLNNTPILQVNGDNKAGVISMRPGAIERWRVINGSVDGRGFKRFMVLKGQYQTVDVAIDANRVKPPITVRRKVVTTPDGPRLAPVDCQQIEDDKQPLYQFSTDGITLVTPDGKYTVKDLSRQNAGAPNPLCEMPPRKLVRQWKKRGVWTTEEQRKLAIRLWQLTNAFKDATNIKNTFVRPNEYYMGPANRTDVFFQLPCDARPGDVFTVFAKGVSVHSDTPPYKVQRKLTVNPAEILPETDIIVAYIIVDGDEPVCGAAGCDDSKRLFDEVMAKVERALPQAPPYLQPVRACELQDESSGKYRTRTVTYSGWGSEGYPLVTTDESCRSSAEFRRFVAENPQLENLVYGSCKIAGEQIQVLMPPAIRTMAIDGRKFRFNDPERPRMLVNTAEEWVLNNTSQTLYADTVNCESQVGQYKGHYVAYPITRGQGIDHFFDRSTGFKIVTRAIDHPFHIHQNPFWMTRLEIPDRDGNLVNILDEPRWMDTIWIPRNFGRVVFRSRFPDYVGTYVHHCHILLHEDNGMMQPVQTTPFKDQANYVLRDELADEAGDDRRLDPRQVQQRLDEAYRANAAFCDGNPMSGQVFPGFPVTPPSYGEDFGEG